MATPVFRSFTSILKGMIQEYVYRSGVNDLNRGSSNRSFLEAAALSDYKIQGDIAAALASVDIDRAENSDLDKVGFSKKVLRVQARESNGVVTIYQKNFTKVSTKVYQGTAAPPAGSAVLNVADVTNMPTSGSIYIGRGTNNLEGPIAYSAITSLGSYYQLTLSSPTTKNHNVGEAVILAQSGNRVVPAGSVVQTRSTLTSQSVTFRTVNSVTLLDGESEIKNVPVICTQIGSIGNIPAKAIVEFSSEPFPNAAATNPLAFVSGRDTMSDPDYRELIKKTEQSRVKGTNLAIKQAAVNVQSTDDNKTVTSAEIRQPADRGEPSILFLDDSTGYEPVFYGQGFEQIIDNANGGEKYLQLQKEDLTRAIVVSSLEAPFAITGGMTLSVKIGGVLSEHSFSSSDFATEGAADTFEIVNSINNNSNLLFSARSANNNSHIVLFAKQFKEEDVQVSTPSSGVNANDYLGFAQTLTYTLRLYKNDGLLIKDGIIPTVYSNPQSTWNNSIVNGSTLKVKVDGTSVQSITVNDADFVPYGYATVNKDNSIDSWAGVLTSKLAGVTVESEGNKLKMTSNLGAKDSARLEVSDSLSSNSLALGDNMWEPQASQGVSSDYSLNKSTGQVELVKPAADGDVFTAGSKFTRGFVDSAEFTSGSVTLGVSPTPKLYFIVDASAERISASLSNSVTVSVTNPSTNTWRYTFSAAVIPNVLKDDLVIITDNTTLSSSNEGSWRINAVGAGTWFEVIRTSGTVEGPISMTGPGDMVFIRSVDGELQQVALPTGLQTLTALANTIKTIKGLTAEVVGGRKIRVSTLTFDPDMGKIFVAAQNLNATTLGFVTADSDTSEISHTAFNISQKDSTFLEFFHDSFSSGDNSSPYTSVSTVVNLDTSGYEPNNKVSFLNPYGVNVSSNRKLNTDIASISGTSLSLRNSSKLNEIISSDRYYIETPFNFHALDSFVAVLDNDTLNKTFNIRMGRKSKVYASPNASTLKAYDVDFAPTANFPSSFGNNFDFSDFKVHMKARCIIDPSGADNRILIRSAVFGPSGNRTRVGFYYPQSELSSIGHSVTAGSYTDIKIVLASNSLRTGGTWDSTTEFDVTNPAGNTWRYSHNGTGTAPNFSSASILVGDIVNISSNSTFSSNNVGNFKVTSITNTYFEVTNYAGGTAETSKTLSVTASLKFFPLDASANKATDIQAYATANLTDYVSVAQLETGAGVISVSTLDETSGVNSLIELQDGENWISSSSVGTTITPTNDFTLKKALNIFGADFLNEEFYLIPTRSEHLSRFLSRFAVTGLSSLGNIAQATDAKALEIYSSLFGSSGTVYVTGGPANLVSAAVSESASIVDSSYIKFGVPKVSSVGFHRGQWVKITNTDKLAKDTKLRSSTQVTWDSLTSVAPNRATISLPNSTTSNIYQNGYFWTKRHHDGVAGTQMRLEKQGRFMCLSWTGTGTEPKFKKTYTINNIARTSNISTVTVSAAHGIAVGSSIQLTVSGLTNSSFNGTFRAVADSTTTFQYRQDGLVNVTSTADSGSAVRQVRKTDRIILGSAFNVANRNEFLVAGVFGNNTIYFEHPEAIEEDVLLTAASDIQLFDYDSVRPGDTFSVGSTALDSVTPFESHKGSFTVYELTSSESEIVILSSAAQDVMAATLGNDFNTVRCIEQNAFSMYAKIHNMAASPSNVNNTDVVIEGLELPAKITPSAGTGIESVSKLNFDDSVRSGEDSYKYYGGLISAVGQKIRGKASDPITYPGVAASGSFIEIDAALPKRIQLSIVIRNRTGTPFSIVKSRVQSAVAAYVNSVGVGNPVVFSRIVTAAQAINGVQAVAISSPTYNATNDQVISQPNQKPLIYNIDSDIIVSQAT